MSVYRTTFVLLLVTALGVWSVGIAAKRVDEDPNYTLIEDGLYMGGVVRRPPPGTRAVLNLCERADSYGADYVLWQPIRDAEPAPDLDWLRRMVDFVARHRQAGGTVYIHCRNGVSRSGLVTVAYLMLKNGWTRDQALKFVRGARPEARPNPAFMDRLKQWERVATAAR